MDNASKALIMAGGILIAVLIISVAIYVLATARGFANEANKDAEASAIASYNRYYESFGPSGSTIKGIDALNIYNRVQDDNNRHTSIRGITINSSAASIANKMSQPDGAAYMNDNYTYTYTYEDAANQTGYIVSITIQ